MNPDAINSNRVVKLAHSNEQLKVDQLMTEIRDVAEKPEYNRVTIAAFLGVLELLKDEYIKKSETVGGYMNQFKEFQALCAAACLDAEHSGTNKRTALDGAHYVACYEAVMALPLPEVNQGEAVYQHLPNVGALQEANKRMRSLLTTAADTIDWHLREHRAARRWADYDLIVKINEELKGESGGELK